MSLLTLIIYLVAQFLICFWISKKIDTESDYFVAGRSFGLFIVAVSLFATWFGAETCIGSSAAVYTHGLSGSRTDPLGYSLCLFLSGFLIAKRIYNKKYMTLSDFYRERFGPRVEQLAVWILSLSSLIWAAAQLRAFGQVISAISQLDLDTTLLIGFIFVVSYTLLGGLMGDMITDVVQAVVIVFGLLLLLYVVMAEVPSFSQVWNNIPREKFSLVGPGESWLARADRWAIPILGSLVAQEIVSRIFSAKSKKVAVQACYASGFIYLALGFVPVFLGLIGPQLVEVQGDTEQFLIQLASQKLSPVLLGIFAGALISALLATIDSILLSVGALVSHNFLLPLFRIKRQKVKLNVSRWVVLSAGLTAYLLATKSEGIYDLLEMASSFGTSGILVITLMGLWTPMGQQNTAVFTLIIGLVATPIAEYGFQSTYPFLVSLAIAAISFFSLSYFNRKYKTP